MKNLQNLEKTIGLEFKNKQLLKKALTHRSYLNEHPEFQLGSNERLEFLGDAVLELIASNLLFQKLPQYAEGLLTDIRSGLVRTTTLSAIAKEIQLGDYLLLSRGEEELGGRKNNTLLANCLEAVIGAIYLDQNFASAQKFILPFLQPRLEKIIKSKTFKDSKSLFQETIQSKEKITPEYKVLDESGPDHNKIFTVGLYTGNKLWAKGKGKSKQEAEEKAAETALKEIQKS